MWLLPVLLILSVSITYVFAVTFPSMTCGEHSNYVNNFDGTHSFELTNNLINGQESYHNNHHEDRRFKWRWCRPSTTSNIQSGNSDINLVKTEYDEKWERGCGGNTGLKYIYSVHDNNREDREWTFKCSELNSDYRLTQCSLSGFLNEYDGNLNYDCPNNGLIRTIHSEHNNNKEDRRFKFECCRVANNDYLYHQMQKSEDVTFTNDWDGSHNNVQSVKFLAGQYSIHDNHHEDRRFRWRYAKPDTDTTPFIADKTLSETEYDSEWTRTCSSLNGGHAAMIGAESTHNNHHEDRKWKFHCGELRQPIYSLVNCGYTGYLNNYDNTLDFNCPNNGVIRSIQSKHNNNHEDRLYKFECCQMARYALSEPQGAWFLIHSCTGCPSTQYSTSIGVQRSSTTSVENSYSQALATTISLSYRYCSAGMTHCVTAGISVTGTVSQTTSNTISSAYSQSFQSSSTFTCDHDHFYQWRQSVTHTLPEVGSETVMVYTGQYLCTDNEEPACPAGWCQDDDCTVCKPGFGSSNPAKINTNEQQDNEEHDIISNTTNTKKSIKWINIIITIISIICGLSIFIIITYICYIKRKNKKIFKAVIHIDNDNANNDDNANNNDNNNDIDNHNTIEINTITTNQSEENN